MLIVEFLTSLLTYLAFMVEQTDGFRDTLGHIDFRSIWETLPVAETCTQGNGDDGNYSQNVLLYLLNLIAEGAGVEVRFELDCW